MILHTDYLTTRGRLVRPQGPNPNTTSGQIAANRLQANGYDVTYSYTYDGNGNILSISDGIHTTSYVYDSANQLLRENNQAGGFTHTWTYDIFGNITSRKEYPYTTGALGTPTDTVLYTYEDEYCWGDRLIGYDGQEIELDNIGNLSCDGTWDYLWRNGRELFFMTNYEKEWFFEYDVNGMRTERSDYEDITYQYVYNGSSLSQMTVGNNTLYFAYGANGAPISVDYNGTTYYYVTNIQGDVIAILDDMGTVVVNYSYDAWGNHLSISGYMSNTLGTLNPLRYRGYVYDQETGLYYLQSRYYNPQWGRFINADAYVSTGQGLLGNNMFAYCNNNPVIFWDPAGTAVITITALIFWGSVGLGTIAGGYTAYKEYQAGFDAWQIVGDSLCAGLSTFSIAYTGGMSLYQCYQNYCYLNGLTPVTHIGSTQNPAPQLQSCADSANAAFSGNGPAVGTKKHSVFAQNVNALGRNDLLTEVSYKDGMPVPYGTKGSVRFDVMQYDSKGRPIAAWDFKTGSAVLTPSRILEMKNKAGVSIPIYEVK